MARYNMTVATSSVQMGMSLSAEYKVVGGKAYEGEYIITPSAEAITLPTDQRFLIDNITVNPIPSNYGLITWNGSYLTVS